MSIFLATQPGTHDLAEVCGSGYVDLKILKFYYCAFNTESLISSGVAMLITLAIGFWIASRLSTGVPGKLQMVLEFLVGYVRQLVASTVAEDAGFVIPLAATIGLFIFVANWLDFLPLVPPVVPANSILNQTLAMALVVIILVEGYSIRVLGFTGFLRRFTKPFELPIPFRAGYLIFNVIEELVKPVTLALRLFGNIFAGTLMIFLIGLLFSYGVTAPALAAHLLAPVALVFLILWKAFDVFFVGTIQAFIFMLLTIIYFGQAREGLEEEHHASGSPAAAAGHGHASEAPVTAQ
jgi:F-type H+-transporting ATPase subunit a